MPLSNPGCPSVLNTETGVCVLGGWGALSLPDVNP